MRASRQYGLQRAGVTVAALVATMVVFASCNRQSSPPAADTNQTPSSDTPVPQPCASATTQAEMTQCWGDAAAAAEQRSGAAWASVMKWLEERQQPDAASMLGEAQARWETYRDAHCGGVAAVYEDGSLAGLQQQQCRFRLAEERRRELALVMSDASN